MTTPKFLQSILSVKELKIGYDIENEYVYTTFKGEPIRFRQTFAGHKFKKKEIESLLAGKEVTINVVNEKTNSKYELTVILGPDAYKDFPFWGARPVDKYNFKDGQKRYKAAKKALIEKKKALDSSKSYKSAKKL